MSVEKQHTESGIVWTLDEESGQLSVSMITENGHINACATVKVSPETRVHLVYHGPCQPETHQALPATELFAAGHLVSNLQKAVRLSLAESAARTAVQMIRQRQLSDLLRRIPIIMVEDVCTQSWFPRIVFYMVLASKGVALSTQVTEHIVSAVYALASQIRVDTTIPEAARCDVSEPNAAFWYHLVCQQSHLPEAKKNQMLAFALRIAYGGMPGDMRLLQETIAKISQFGRSPLWDTTNTRRGNCDSEWMLLDREVLDRVSGGLEGEQGLPHRLLVAIDFHCSGVIPHLQTLWPDANYFALKRCIWHLRSCLNVRSILTRKKLTSTVRTPLVTPAGCATPANWSAMVAEIDNYARLQWQPTNQHTSSSVAASAARSPAAPAASAARSPAAPAAAREVITID